MEPILTDIPRSDLLNLNVTLINTDGSIITERVVRSYQPTDYINNRPLKPGDIEVLVLDLVIWKYVPLDWKFSVQRWPTKLVIYNGTLLFELGRDFKEEL